MSKHSWLAVALLGGCITTPEHHRDYHETTATVSGVVEIDSAIANATVFIDYNDNNLLDPGEPSAVTDATGHYTLTWTYPWFLYPDTIGAVVTSDSTRVGVMGDANVGFALHMRAPLRDVSGALVDRTVISPLSTLVVSEMASNAALDQDRATRKVAAALTASHLPFSGQRFDVMADYATDYMAGTASSADSAQLRYVSSTVAVLVAAAATKCNSVQSHIDCNDSMLFDPAIVAMDTQLTRIADGTFNFSQLSAAQQADMVQNPQNYTNYFIDVNALAEQIKAALLEAAEDLAAAVFAEIEGEFVQELDKVVVEEAVDLLSELL